MKAPITIAYGVLVAASGVYRFFQTGHSYKALWFGLIMGAVAVLGGLLLRLKNRIPGTLVAFVAVGFVGGYFLYRMFTHETDGTSVRVCLVVLASFIEAAVLLTRSNRGESS